MANTAAEKILSRAAGREVRAGDVVAVTPDLTWIPSGFGLLGVRALKTLGVEKIRHPEKALTWLVEPAFSAQVGIGNIILEKWSAEQGVRLIRGGVPNGSLAREGFARPGTLVAGLDSHSPTLGAAGCLSFAIGDTELGVVLATGAVWTRVPETIAFRLHGKLRPDVAAKDVALHIIGTYGMAVGRDRVVEFIGPGLAELDMWSRLSLCNMSTEMGAFSGFVAPVRTLLEGLGPYDYSDGEVVLTDDESCYERIIDVDLGALEPLVACPHSPENVHPVESVTGVPVTHAFLGSCTNAWISDLRAAAAVLDGRTISPNVRMIVSPVDRKTYLEAEEEGLLKVFARAGATISQPFCSMCSGLQNRLGPDDACISSSGRNFKARMGDPASKIYIASAATVAASAIHGRLTDPRDAR